jgi:photosystem II stability/assembly factor-like uncharacterized protein
MKQLILLGLLFLPLIGCSGSGAVNPLSPTNATKAEPGSTADSDVIYWSNFPLENPVSDSINAICLINKKLGWACGNNGLVMQYDGQTWNRIQTGLAPNENFMTIGFLNENEGWLAGTHGVILHYYNGQWTQDNSPSTEILYSIAITRSRTVWLVGSNGAILTYNGISWGTVYANGGTAAAPTTVADIYSIGLSDQNSGWAVGNLGLILKYDGQKWTSYTASPTTERLNSISVISDVQSWAVGAYGTILSFNGTTWTKAASAFSGFDLFSISMIDESDGWLAGQDGTIAFYDGTRWISHVKPETRPSLNAIAFYKDLGFMAGQNGTFIKFQKGGVPAKFDITFKGLVTEKPTKTHPYWTLTYSLLNQSSKTTAALDFVLPIPKGFEPYQPKATPTSGPADSNSAAVPTVAVTTPTPTMAVSSSTPGTKTAATTSVAVTGDWKMKDGNLVWEIGTVTTSESKTIKILLASKKGEKKEYPVVLNASLKTVDRTIADAAPVTMLVSEPIPVSTSTVTIPVSTLTPNTSPDSTNTQGETGVKPTSTVGN